jgi:UDP-N-acetyl-2-amino-2-deoxyglucuronate dehydrogenase
MTDKFRFVIVGTGNISNTYAKAIGNIPEAEIVGAVSRGMREPAWASSGLEVESSLSAIKAGFDGVIVCTPNAFHHEGTIEAANLGKHVLCEKPIDITLPSADLMIEACRKAGVKLGVAYQRRMSPDIKAVKELLEKNALGRVFAVELTVNNYRDDNYYRSGKYRGTWSIDGGGPFMQQASHYIDIYGWYFGKPAKIVSMMDTFIHDIEVEDHGAAILRHEDGMIGVIIASTAAKPGFDARLEIHAERGTVLLENDIIVKWAVDGVPNPSRPHDVKIMSGASSHTIADTSLHEAIIKDFITAVRGDGEPLVTGKSARLATEIILEIYRSKAN